LDATSPPRKQLASTSRDIVFSAAYRADRRWGGCDPQYSLPCH